MPWTWNTIWNDWMGGSPVLEHSESEIVAAFDRVERLLGLDWIYAKRHPAPGVTEAGAKPTLDVVKIGLELQSLEGAEGADGLVQRLRANDRAAFSELRAAHLLRRGEGEIQLHIAPEVDIDGRQKVPDFRIRRPSDSWTYVEVNQPSTSEESDQATTMSQRIGAAAQEVLRSFSLHVHLKTILAPAQESKLLEEVRSFLESGKSGEVRVEDWAVVVLGESSSVVSLGSKVWDDDRPRLMQSFGSIVAGVAHQQITVYVSVSDERADDALRKEARQLPIDAPGLIMFGMKDVPGGFSWEKIIRRRLQPTLHTRVSAVCLFRGLMAPGKTPGTSVIEIRRRHIPNPHARLPLPQWIGDRLSLA